MDPTRVVQYSFRKGRLPRVDVSRYPDVPELLQRLLPASLLLTCPRRRRRQRSKQQQEPRWWRREVRYRRRRRHRGPGLGSPKCGEKADRRPSPRRSHLRRGRRAAGYASPPPMNWTRATWKPKPPLVSRFPYAKWSSVGGKFNGLVRGPVERTALLEEGRKGGTAGEPGARQ